MMARRLIICGLLAVLLVGVGAIYIRALYAPLILDDVSELALALSWQSPAKILGPDCYGFFRPVKNVIFYTLSRFPHSVPVAGHVVSIVLFGLSIILAFFYFRRALGSEWWAFVASSIWALAPTQVAVVVWLSCANQLVMMCAAFGAMILYERSQATAAGSRSLAWIGVTVCSLLAMASYEVAVVLPALIVLHDALVDPHRLRMLRNRAGYLALFALAGVFVALRFVLGNRTLAGNQLFAPITRGELVLSSGYFIVEHLSLWLWPFGRQNLLRSFDLRQEGVVLAVAAAWFVLAALILVSIHLRRRAPWIGWGLLWFGVALFPVSNIVPLFVGPFGDYYLPLASMGLVLAIVLSCRWLVAGWRPSRTVLQRLAAVVLIGAAAVWFGFRVAATAQWVLTWNSEEALFRKTLEAYPESHSARGNLARVLSEEGLLDEAIREANKVMADAPWQTHAYYSLADALLRYGRLEEAMDVVRRVHDVAPTEVYPSVLAGFIQEQLGDVAAAERFYREALKLPWNPEQSPTAALNLGRMLAVSDRLDDAMEVWLSASQRAPLNGVMQHNLALAYAQKGNEGMAQKHAGMAASLGVPVDARLLCSLLAPKTNSVPVSVEPALSSFTQRVCRVKVSAAGDVTVDEKKVTDMELTSVLDEVRTRADAIAFSSEIPTNTPVFEKVMRTGLPVIVRPGDASLRAGPAGSDQTLQNTNLRDVPVSRLIGYYASLAGSRVLNPAGIEARVSLSMDDASRDEALTAVEVELSRHNIAISRSSDDSIQVRWKKAW